MAAAGVEMGREERGPRATLALVSTAHGVTHAQATVFGLITPFAMRSLGFGYTQVGLMIGLTNLLFGLCQGAHAWLSRWVPRKGLLGSGNALIGVALALSALSRNFAFFFASRAVASVGSSPQHPMGASLLSDLYPRERRGAAFAVHFSGGNVGTLVAPLLAGLLLAHTGWRQTLVCFALPAVAVGLLLWLLADEGRRPGAAAAAGAARRPQAGVRLAALRERNVALILLSSFFSSAGQGVGIILTYVPLYLISALHLPATAAGAYITVLTGASVAAPVAAGRIADRTGRRPVLVGSLWLAALAVLCLVRAGGSPPGLVAALALLGLSAYNYSPLSQALLADVVRDHERDGVFSVYYVVSYAFGALWGLIIGLVVARWGFAPAFEVMLVSFVLCGGVFLLLREQVPPGREAA